MARNEETERERAIREAWKAGVLHWKLNATQRDMREQWTQIPEDSRVVILARRQLGKSYLLVTLALERAFQKPGSQIKYISATKKSVQDFLLPLFEQILADCPKSIRPVWLTGAQQFRFNNGSLIALGGTDSKHYKKLRGQHSHFTILDEAGFMNDLDTVVEAVLAPQALTTGAQMILASSAPDVADHPFARYVRDARAMGLCIERTIYQTIATTEAEAAAQKAELIRAVHSCGGENTAAFRREYMNQLDVVDTRRAVIPEFTPELVKEIVKEVERPKYCHKYTSLDLGFADQTACLFGYLNFDTQTLIVEDEWTAVKAVSDDIAEAVRGKEAALWPNEQPLIRIADAPPMPLEELRRAGVGFLKTRNDDPESQINEVRKLLKERKIIIHPRCTKLVSCVAAAVRTSNPNKFKLDRHQVHGHFDLLMSLVYLVRNLRRHENPKPKWLGIDPLNKPWIKVRDDLSSTIGALRAAFKPPKF